jgi:anti-sigma regulatory factor (Ser/Thr protein kinase)
MMVAAQRQALPVRSDVHLMVVREATRSAAATAGFSLVSQTKLVTAVSELARNAVLPGRRRADGPAPYGHAGVRHGRARAR